MNPIQRKGRSRQLASNPFPTCSERGTAYFNGADFETFDKTFIASLYEAGQFGVNPKPRQATGISKVESKDQNESSHLPKSLIFFAGK